MHNDGWTNLLSGLGKLADKTAGTSFGEAPVIGDAELAAIYGGAGIGANIVDMPAEDAVRPGWEIPADTDGALTRKLDAIGLPGAIEQALKWARLFGGAIVVLGIKDGLDLSQPVTAAAGDLAWARVYDRTQITLTSADFGDDPKSIYYEVPYRYNITRAQGTPVTVHASRCLVFRGVPVPYVAGVDLQRRYWGDSALVRVYSDLLNLGAGMQGIAHLMQEVSVGKYKIAGLQDILSENNTQAMWDRLEIINAAKSVINAVLLGETEDYTRDSVSFSGTPEIIDRQILMVSASSGIPVTRLFGRAPAGLNSTGEADLRTYYDRVGAIQWTKVCPEVQKAALIANAGMRRPVPVDQIAVIPNSPWEPTQQETLSMRKSQAEIDQIYLNAGVLAPDEVAQSRFAGGYGFDTTLASEHV